MSKPLRAGGSVPLGETVRHVGTGVGLAAVALVSAVLMASLVAVGQAPIALALLLALPGFVLFNRYPLAAVFVWLIVGQFIVTGEGGIERKVYWVVHRAMPLAVVLIMVLGSTLGTRKAALPRFGPAEYLILGYVAATLFSVWYLSPTATASTYHVYDRVIAPVGLYLVVRLSVVKERDLARMLPFLFGVVALQSFIGLVSWVRPGVLPNAWLGREGQRTIGSLGHPNVFGVAMLTCGALLLHAAFTLPMSRLCRTFAVSGFLMSLLMAFLTFGRANWVAAFVVVVGLVVLYPRKMVKLVVLVIPVLVLAAGSGLFNAQIERAQNRFLSDQSAESALSRLPVVYASLLMFEAKPITGWGYGNFDLYDRQFQPTITDVVVPEKDHASHNLYLTIMAEQGTVGILLYLGPAVVILLTALQRRKGLPDTGFVSKKLQVVLALCLLAHFAVNNFANMRIVYGLGLWWITLGLLAGVNDRAVPTEPTASPEQQIARIPLEGLIQRAGAQGR